MKESIQIMREVVEAIEKEESLLRPANCDAAKAIKHFYTSDLEENYRIAENNRAHVVKKINEFVAKSYVPEIVPHRADIEKLRELFAMVYLNLDIKWELVKN